jgi:hypothetical protein
MKQNKYGKEHQDAKEAKRASMGEVRCQITGEKDNLHMHHNTPLFFNGANHPSNYMAIASYVHDHLHESANIQDVNVVQYRVSLTRKLMQCLLDEEQAKLVHEKIQHIDQQLIHEYVENLLAKVQHQYRERIIHETIVTGMNATRDLTIELHKERAKRAMLEAKILELEAERDKKDLLQ